jgi:tRNA nucleotidyltransferase (CCA-adding enzyme)
MLKIFLNNDDSTYMSLKRVLSIKELKILKEVLGEEADLHLVGGAVRDILLGKKYKDLDLASKLTISEVTDKLARSDKYDLDWIPTGIRWGTVTIIVNKTKIELTTFKSPRPGSDHLSNPGSEVVGTVGQDLAVRDFTINAMAISLTDGSLLDLFGGRKDLRKGVLRTVGNPSERFLEDPHRILRMVRFGVAEGRVVDKVAYEAAKQLSNLVSSVAKERVNHEFSKIVCSPFAGAAINQLHKLDILELIVPELVRTIGVSQRDTDVFNHTLDVLDSCVRNKTTRLAALYHDIGRQSSKDNHEVVGSHLAAESMKNLKYSKKHINRVVTLIKTHRLKLNSPIEEIRKLILITGKDLNNWLSLKKSDLFTHPDYKEFKRDWSKFVKIIEVESKNVDNFNSVNLNGDDLIEIGFKDGPIIGKIISHLKSCILKDPTLNNKTDLIKIVKSTFKEKINE